MLESMSASMQTLFVYSMSIAKASLDITDMKSGDISWLTVIKIFQAKYLR